ncbi:class I SAM-dependent methyltransferase [Aestuariivivens insulae]|uniref:class I SAM-dependent methyltransferase n=1 Tax=Aestuariivivens insulae TaxID=1621988 RepID=UPI001F58014A|nr:class I SAM-dependent methyltransferase [Aestuariivivens insulae]
MKQLIPFRIKKYYWRFLKWRRKQKKRRIKFDGKSPKEVFTYIYNTNYWSGHQSISGGGSDLHHTQVVIDQISRLIKEFKFSSILDVPCGDFIWMQHVDLLGCNYTGGDIVEALIQENIEKYKHDKNIRFQVIDLLKDDLPKSDILINRDGLVHLSFDDIFKALGNIKNSGCNYLLSTTFPNHKENKDIVTGDWRPLNLEEAPFYFGSPLKLIKEKYQHPDYHDKSLGLWKIEDIKL